MRKIGGAEKIRGAGVPPAPMRAVLGALTFLSSEFRFAQTESTGSSHPLRNA